MRGNKREREGGREGGGRERERRRRRRRRRRRERERERERERTGPCDSTDPTRRAAGAGIVPILS